MVVIVELIAGKEGAAGSDGTARLGRAAAAEDFDEAGNGLAVKRSVCIRLKGLEMEVSAYSSSREGRGH